MKRAEELAQQDGVSLDVWVTSVLAQKIGAVETAAEIFRLRSSGAGKELNSYLDLIPDNPQFHKASNIRSEYKVGE